ncbi:MAG TPA: ABC transporter substrate-binding protein [Lachnospiraceae bacterium]|nr:ABC transporter substrate-binding protein [Lachnospiraceae bacterium]
MKMKKLTALLLASLMAVSMTACGGTPASGDGAGSNDASDSSSESSTDASGSSEESSTDASDSTEEASGSDSAESSDGGSEASGQAEGFTTAVEGKLTMATNAAFPPYEYVEGGQIAGIDAEIAAAIADKLGLELQIDDMEFDSITEAIKGGKADIGLAGMTVTPDRQEEVDFTVSYATGVQVIIVTEDSDITSADDLLAEGASHTIGVQRNTTGDIYTTGDIEDAGLGTIDRYSKGAEAVQALTTGKVDCVVIDNEPAKAFVAEVDGLKILDTEYITEDYAAAMSKENSALYEAVNTALQELIADGTVQGIIDKYITAE